MSPSPTELARDLVRSGRKARTDIRLRTLRRRLEGHPAGQPFEHGSWLLGFTDPGNLYMQLKDEVVHGIYDFVCDEPDPFVIDGGANIGLSILRTLEQHPGARITAFEPDAEVRRILEENLRRNGADHATVLPLALGGEPGTASFEPDGMAGGRLQADGAMTVEVAPLSPYVTERVAFMKLNIEGAELDVLEELRDAGKLDLIDRMVIEYHGWQDGEQRLGPLLTLLDEAGFRYLVHDFDEETCATTKPPFSIRPANWFLLVYAERQVRAD